MTISLAQASTSSDWRTARAMIEEYAESLGVDGYLLKPVPLARLLEKAVELIDARDEAAGDADEGDEDGTPEGDEE